MKELQEKREPPHVGVDSFRSESPGLLKTGVFSLFIHIAILALVTLTLKPAIHQGQRVYHVTLRPYSPPGPGTPQGAPGLGTPGTPGPHEGLPPPPAAEKLKPEEGPKENKIVESIKPPQKKLEKSEKREVREAATKQKPDERLTGDEMVVGKKPLKKGEIVEKEKGSRISLQEAIEDIHKKVALDEIQKRVARRGGLEKGTREGQEVARPAQRPIGPSTGSSPPSGSGSGTGPGSGTGTGPGSGGFQTGGSPWGSSSQGSSLWDSKLDQYYSLIWAKIKEEWTLPENLPKGKTDLETIIVVIIEREGKIQKSWFEKRSGNTLYDQMAMRAIKKAEPLPPIPKEFSDNTFEIGIRFHPD